MESENRMRGEIGRKEGGNRKSERDKDRAMERERERQGGDGGLKMMIHPDPSECCHVPPSR